MNKFLTVGLLLIAGLLIFVVGGGAGVFYQTQKDAPQLTALKLQADQGAKLSKILSSKVIVPITVSGLVKNISGKNITLSYGGDNITVNIKDDAVITNLAVTGKNQVAGLVTLDQFVDFSHIKKGDNIRVTVELLTDGTLAGKYVSIISPKNAE